MSTRAELLCLSGAVVMGSVSEPCQIVTEEHGGKGTRMDTEERGTRKNKEKRNE